MAEVPPSVAQNYLGTLVPTVAGSLFVWARLYTRTFMTRNLGTDDALIFAAWVCAIILSVTNLLFSSITSPSEYGRQSPQDAVHTLKLAYASRLIYQVCLLLTKLSIAVFYLRIFQDRTSRYIIYAMISLIAVSFIPLELAVVFSCSPVQGFWSLTDRHCLPPNPSIYAHAIVNIVADAAMMAFVLPRIINLKMAFRQKVSLLAILSLGFIVIAATIVRLTHSVQGFINVSTWNGFEISTWSAVEIAVGFFCASAPCIRPLVLKIAPRFITSSFSSSSATEPRSRPKSTPNGHNVILTSLGGGMKNKGFGLVSKTETTLSRHGESSASWGTKRKGEGTESDTGSEREIYAGYGRGVKEGEIVKTVSVTVSDEVRGKQESAESQEDLEMGRGVGMVRFEHV